jgi:phosphoserine phosphatase RsbU/P
VPEPCSLSFYISILIIIHLAIRPSLISYGNELIAGYTIVMTAWCFTLFPIVFKTFRHHLVLFLIVLIVIVAIGTRIIFLNVGSDFDKASGLLMFAGMLFSVGGLRLYSNVMWEVTREKTRIETEIKLAQRIQSDLLPVIDFTTREYQIFGKTINAREVGGDLFDAVQITDDQCAVCVGDVSGHNIGAGILMGIVKSAFRAELRHNRNLADLTKALNQTVIEQRSRNMFVSFAVAVFDFKHLEITLVDAGHTPILHYEKDNNIVRPVKLNGPALGLSSEMRFIPHTFSLKRGDVFVFFTDGLTENRNEHGDEYGMNRLMEVTGRAVALEHAAGIYTHLQYDVNVHIGKTERIDDITMLIVKIH